MIEHDAISERAPFTYFSSHLKDLSLWSLHLCSTQLKVFFLPHIFCSFVFGIRISLPRCIIAIVQGSSRDNRNIMNCTNLMLGDD